VADHIGADAEYVVHLFCAGDGDETQASDRDQCMLAAVRLAVWMQKLYDSDERVQIASPREALADLVTLETHGSVTGVLQEGVEAPRVSWELAKSRMEVATL
jgi:hypothetical protein